MAQSVEHTADSLSEKNSAAWLALIGYTLPDFDVDGVGAIVKPYYMGLKCTSAEDVVRQPPNSYQPSRLPLPRIPSLSFFLHPSSLGRVL